MNKDKNLNPKNIKFLNYITTDSYSNYWVDNTFIIFKSINNILFLIYSNKNKSIISYNLITNQKLNEIKKAHEDYITNFRYYFFKNNTKKDLFLSISAYDNNLKIWNVSNFECICNIKNVNKNGLLLSACFLKDKNKDFIITSNDNLYYSEFIKIFDFKGNKLKEIEDFNFNTFFIDTFYDSNISQNYIITGNFGYIKSYNFFENKIYRKYFDENDNSSHINVNIYNFENEINLIESSNDGYIRTWEFHSGKLLNKIKICTESLISICIWDKDYIFFGCRDKTIKLIQINEKKVLKNLNCPNNRIISIKKFNHPSFGECLITQGYEKEQIKLWN